MRLVCLSDTHGFHRRVTVPDGDILVFAGDLTGKGEFPILNDFCEWLKNMPHRDKVVIFGNHETFAADLDSARSMIRDTGAKYLENSWCDVQGKRFWGSPYTPPFFNWAFMRTENELSESYLHIPHSTDILVTHGPPFGILDSNGREHCGSKALLSAVDERPWLEAHIFGHIHESYGHYSDNGVQFVNASIGYRSENPPIILDLE